MVNLTNLYIVKCSAWIVNVAQQIARSNFTPLDLDKTYTDNKKAHKNAEPTMHPL